MIQSSKNDIDQNIVIHNQSLHDKNNSIKLRVNFQNNQLSESDENSIEINMESNFNIQNHLDYEERSKCQYNKFIEKHDHNLNDNQINFEKYTKAMKRYEKKFDIESTYDIECNQKESSGFDKNV